MSSDANLFTTMIYVQIVAVKGYRDRWTRQVGKICLAPASRPDIGGYGNPSPCQPTAQGLEMVAQYQ